MNGDVGSVALWLLILAATFYRPGWRARRAAERARRWRRAELRLQRELVMDASKEEIARAIAHLERQFQATEADTE